MKTLLIDNYDSYAHLLAYYIYECTHQKPIILKNDALSLREISYLEFDQIVISPGPGHPDKKKDFGICKELMLAYKYKKPILGICLGHQGMGSLFGFKVIQGIPMHGKISKINHFGSELFEGIPKEFEAMRYHSLLLKETKSKEVEIIAREASMGLIMGIKIKNTSLYGIQFHPESIGTAYGKKIIENFFHLKKKPEISDGKKKIKDKKFYFEELNLKNFSEEEIFYKVYQNKKEAIWLDSSLKNENGSISIMASPSCLLYSKRNKLYFKNLKTKKKKQIKTSPFFFIKKDLEKNKIQKENLSHNCKEAFIEKNFPFVGGWMGYFSYEAKDWLESPKKNQKGSLLPQIFMMKIKHFIFFDHKNQKIILMSFSKKEAHLKFKEKVLKKLNKKNSDYKKVELIHRDISSDSTNKKLQINASFSKEEYIRAIEKIKKKLRRGESYEICLSNGFKTKLKTLNFELYQILRLINPAPFSTYIQFGKRSVFSSSPERFVKLDAKGFITSQPIKGTRKASLSEKENQKIATELLHCQKDRSELLMITDLIRNDLSSLSQKDSLRVEELFKINCYSSVIQLSSIIHASLDSSYDGVDLLINLFPGGSISGAPKIRSMQIIKRLEKRKRGLYTGSIGYFSYSGAMDFNIAIRTIEKKKSKAFFGAGGAITIESDPEEEYQEVLIKANPLIKALHLASFGEYENYKIKKDH